MTNIKSNLPKIKSVKYRGDQYYASGELRDLRINYKERTLWGKINIKGNPEWVDTLFRFESKDIIIEWEEVKEKKEISNG